MAFKKFRYNISGSIIRKTSSIERPNKLVTGLEKAKTIGILAGPVDQVSVKVLKRFILTLKDLGKKINVIGYIDSKELPQFCLSEPSIDFFCKKDISWIYKPKLDTIDNFISKDFDILLSLNLEECPPIDYICAKSRSKFKVGRLTGKMYQYDFMIDISKNESLDYLMENITHYLSLIKN